jgi:hypothetical protein
LSDDPPCFSQNRAAEHVGKDGVGSVECPVEACEKPLQPSGYIKIALPQLFSPQLMR